MMMLNQAPIIRWSQRTLEAPQEILHKGLIIQKGVRKKIEGRQVQFPDRVVDVLVVMQTAGANNPPATGNWKFRMCSR